MVKTLLTLLLTSVLAFSVPMSAFAQAGSKEGGAKGAPAAKQDRWEGVVTRINNDKSTLTVRQRSSNIEKTVQYDSSTQWQSQEHRSKKINPIDASQVKDNDRVICLGTFDKDGILHATLISKRLTN